MNHLFSIRALALSVTTLTIAGLCLTATAAPPVPFQGRADIVVTNVEDLSPTSQKLTGSATGKATHLGRFTRTETITLDLNTFAFTGTLVFTAANGDQLSADVSGQFTSPTTAVGTYSFTGGNGRFHNASGQAAVEVTAVGMGLFDATFKGTIQY